MEFGEKLQELRKRRGLTQEELAQALYVSRTAISKWESGRGYPSIDSLKEISGYFSVTIDELLSGERLLSLAEKENQANIRSMCDRLFGVTDLCALMLMVLPIYPETADGFVYSVNLLMYTESAAIHRSVYWILFLSLVFSGILKAFLVRSSDEKNHERVTRCSMALGVISVFFLALTRETYAVILAFLLLLIKGMLLFTHVKAGR